MMSPILSLLCIIVLEFCNIAHVYGEDFIFIDSKWQRIRQDFNKITTGSTNNAKVTKANALMDTAEKQLNVKEPPLSYGANLLTMADFTTQSIGTLKNWNNNQAAQNIQTVLNIASAAVVFIPVAGPVLATILQLASVMMSFGIEQGPSTEEIFSNIIANQFNSAEMKKLKALLEEEKEKFKNAANFISIVTGRPIDECLDEPTRNYFFSILNEDTTSFFPQAKSRFDDIFTKEVRYLDAFHLLVGICEFATQRYLYVMQILGIAAKQQELNCDAGYTLYERAKFEIKTDLPNSIAGILTKLRKPPSGAMKCVKYLSKSEKNEYIEAWLNHKVFINIGETMNNLPVFSHEYNRGTWKEWQMCNPNRWAYKFVTWIDNDWWDNAGLSQLKMICTDENSKTLGTAAWGDESSIQCSSPHRITGFENCIPHRISDDKGKEVYWYSERTGIEHPECESYFHYDYYMYMHEECIKSTELVGQNGLRIKCSNNVYREVDGGQCEWTGTSNCKSNFAVCGFNVKATPHSGDDTGINDVALKCCDTNNWNNQYIVHWNKSDKKFNNYYGITDNVYFIAFICVVVVILFGFNIGCSIKIAARRNTIHKK